MHIQGPTSIHGPQAINAHHIERANAPTTAAATQSPVDRVEISSAGQWLEQVNALPDIRHDRVASLRQQIASGTYETENKLNRALESLLDEIA